MFRILHFLALFGYLNLLCFEVNTNDFLGTVIKTNETLVEVVLEDVLQIPHADANETNPEMIFDDYRAMALFLGILPVILYFTWLFSRIIDRKKLLNHPFYLSKTQCLPGYYSFLYRYRPF